MRVCFYVTEDGSIGTGAAPTGSSVGMYESCVLRDGDPNEYNGMSVHKAVDNVNNIIAPRLIGMDVSSVVILIFLFNICKIIVDFTAVGEYLPKLFCIHFTLPCPIICYYYT